MFKVNPEDCFCCGVCVDCCKKKALSVGKDSAYIDQNLCVKCGLCSKVCPAGAITKS